MGIVIMAAAAVSAAVNTKRANRSLNNIDPTGIQEPPPLEYKWTLKQHVLAWGIVVFIASLLIIAFIYG